MLSRNLKQFERIEALEWAIEDHDLMIHEKRELLKYHEEEENTFGKRLLELGKEREFLLLRETSLQWTSWAKNSLNALSYNRLFLKNRLSSLLEEA